MNEETKLKPCPFCGHDARFFKFKTDGHYGSVVCDDCGAMTAASEKDVAIERWNHRVLEVE